MSESGAPQHASDRAPDGLAARRAEAWAESGVSRALFEQSPFSTVIYDAEGHLLAVNSAFRALWGVGIETAPADYTILTDPELERQGALPLIRRAFAGEPVVTPVVRYDISKVAASGAGRTLWTQAHLFPVRDAGGAITHVVLTHIDLTARMEAEEALRVSEERFRGAQEGSPDAFAIFRPARDDAGRVVDFVWDYANPAALRAQGTTLDELRGQCMLARNPGIGESSVFASYVHTAETGEPFETEMRYQHEGIDGWFRITAVRLGDGIALTFSDVTARNQSEERARRLLALAAGLSEALTPEQVADTIFREGMAALGADAGSLALLREPVGEGDRYLDVIRTRGYEGEAERQYQRFPLTAGRPTSDAVLSLHPILVGSFAEWRDRYPGRADIIAALGYEAFAAVPVVSGERALGALSFSFRGPRTFDEATRTFLQTLGQLCGQALERARAFDAERRELARSETILHAVQDGFVAFDHEFRYTYVNARAEQLLDYPAAAMLGRTLWEAFPLARESPFAEMLREAMRERRVLSREEYSPVVRRWLDVRCYPAEDGLVLLFQDVTDRRRAQDATAFIAEASRLLSASMDYEQTLKNLAHAAVPRLGDWCAVDVLVDPASTAWPPAIERLAVVHQDPEKIALGATLTAEYPQDWSRPAGMPRVIREGVSEFYPVVTDEMIVAGARDARHLRILRALQFSAIMIVPLVARGRVLGALTLCMTESGRRYAPEDLALAEDLARRAGVAVDNTRLLRDAERARREAEAANRAKSDFLATMSHELRTPLNAIGGYAQLLEMELRGPLTPEQREDLERIRRSQAHLLGLINAVLNFARLEAGRVTYELSDVHLEPLLREAVSLMEPQARAQGLTLAPVAAEGTLLAHADPEKVRQVVLNLLSNAVKFTPAGGTVSVSCALVGRDRVALRVTDTGIGIPAGQLARVFDPFVQVGRGLTSAHEGAGLGLSISRDLARGMGGDLTAESAVGVGSTFTLVLPRG
jgi:PAS domain S-box-containing protein